MRIETSLSVSALVLADRVRHRAGRSGRSRSRLPAHGRGRGGYYDPVRAPVMAARTAGAASAVPLCGSIGQDTPRISEGDADLHGEQVVRERARARYRVTRRRRCIGGALVPALREHVGLPRHRAFPASRTTWRPPAAGCTATARGTPAACATSSSQVDARPGAATRSSCRSPATMSRRCGDPARPGSCCVDRRNPRRPSTRPSRSAVTCTRFDRRLRRQEHSAPWRAPSVPGGCPGSASSPPGSATTCACCRRASRAAPTRRRAAMRGWPPGSRSSRPGRDYREGRAGDRHRLGRGQRQDALGADCPDLANAANCIVPDIVVSPYTRHKVASPGPLALLAAEDDRAAARPALPRPDQEHDGPRPVQAVRPVPAAAALTAGRRAAPAGLRGSRRPCGSSSWICQVPAQPAREDGRAGPGRCRVPRRLSGVTRRPARPRCARTRAFPASSRTALACTPSTPTSCSPSCRRVCAGRLHRLAGRLLQRPPVRQVGGGGIGEERQVAAVMSVIGFPSLGGSGNRRSLPGARGACFGGRAARSGRRPAGCGRPRRSGRGPVAPCPPASDRRVGATSAAARATAGPRVVPAPPALATVAPL